MATVLNNVSKPLEPVSVCMIVKNEEKCLERALKSVKGWARQIVVLDTGSTDKTVEIAKKYTDCVYQYAKQGDFSFADARNESLKYAECEWILILDADEELRETSRGLLHELFESYQCACNITIRNWMADSTTVLVGKQPVWEGDRCRIDFLSLRIFRNLPGVKFDGIVHELVDPFFKDYPVCTEPKIIIDHWGKTDPQKEKEKTQSRLDLALRGANENPSLQSHWNVIQEALKAENWNVALIHCLKYSEKTLNIPYFVIYSAAMAHQRLGEHEEAERDLETILNAEWNHPEALALMGLVKAHLNKIDEAIAYLKAALVRKSTIATINLHELYAQLGKTEEALMAIDAGLMYNPNDSTLMEMKRSFKLNKASREQPRVE